MSDLKTEIRAAFEQEQTPFPPPVGLRSQIVDAVGAAPVRIVHRDEPNLQWLAVAAAVLVTVSIVAGLVAIRFSQRPTPVRDFGSNRLYVEDPNHAFWLIGYDWQGHPRATIKLPAPADPESARVTMAPDGGAFEYFPGNGILYLDRLGNPITPGLLPDVNATVSQMWADDSRHLCFLRFDTPSVEWRLITKLPGEADHMVAVVAKNRDPNTFNLSLASCSFASNQAILDDGPNGSQTELTVVRLSDGAVLARHPYPTGTVDRIVASQDGQLVAETSAAATTTPTSIIRRVSDWKVIPTARIGYQVLGFSGDRSLTLVTWVSEIPTSWHYAVIDWRTGALVWRFDGLQSLYSFTAEPGGKDFAVALGDPPIPRPLCTQDQACPPFVPVRVIEIVHADGSVTTIPGHAPTW